MTDNEYIKMIHDDVKETKNDVKSLDSKFNDLALSVERLKTQSAIWGTLGGSVFGIIVSIMFKKLI